MSLAMFDRLMATVFRARRRLDGRVAVGHRLEVVGRRAERQAGLAARAARPSAAGNSACVLIPVPTRRAADRPARASASRRSVQPPDAVLDLRGVAGELLPEPDRHRVLQVGPADLDDGVERRGLRVERARASRSQGGDQALLRSPPAAATWIAVGMTSLDDCPMLTASLGWTGVLPPATAGRPSRWRSRRSPRWCSCSSRCRCRSGRCRRRTGRRAGRRRPPARPGRSARRASGSSRPRSMLTCAAAFLIRPMARMKRAGTAAG